MEWVEFRVPRKMVGGGVVRSLLATPKCPGSQEGVGQESVNRSQPRRSCHPCIRTHVSLEQQTTSLAHHKLVTIHDNAHRIFLGGP